MPTIICSDIYDSAYFSISAIQLSGWGCSAVLLRSDRNGRPALLESGVSLKVTIMWDGSVSKLYLNDTLVQSSSDAKATPNWTTASTFDLGAYEYLTFGGYNSSDDVIDEFTLATVPGSPLSAASAVPANPVVSNEAATVGARFSSDIDGSIAGIRFYKGAGNNGTHTGLLYTSSGALLARATFSNETVAGWQQVKFY